MVCTSSINEVKNIKQEMNECVRISLHIYRIAFDYSESSSTETEENRDVNIRTLFQYFGKAESLEPKYSKVQKR
jgi:hypothetical protein